MARVAIIGLALLVAACGDTIEVRTSSFGENDLFRDIAHSVQRAACGKNPRYEYRQAQVETFHDSQTARWRNSHYTTRVTTHSVCQRQ